MASDNGNSNLKQFIEKLRASDKDGISMPTIVETTLKTAKENDCRVINFDKSYYIQKGNKPKALLHLNIDNPMDISLNISSLDDEKSIFSHANINLISSAIVINYLLMFSNSSFDVLISYNNIQSNIEDYREISSVLRTKNIINLNLRQADSLADEFSSLLLALITVPVDRFKPEFQYKTYRLSLTNLMGGHAGDNINKVRKTRLR